MRTPPPIPRLVPERVSRWRERSPTAADPITRAIVDVLVRGPGEVGPLCEEVAAARLAVQERVAALLREQLFDTPRGAEQERLRTGPHALATAHLAIDLEARDAILAPPNDHLARCEALRAHLDADEARHRAHELFASRAAFAIPERDAIDQTQRFMATYARVERLLGSVPLPPRDPGPLPEGLDLVTSLACAHLPASVRASSPTAMGDIVALFVGDLGTLLDGRAPRPLPSWL